MKYFCILIGLLFFGKQIATGQSKELPTGKMSFRLAADSALEIDQAGRVVAWKDISGRGYVFTAADGEQRPVGSRLLYQRMALKLDGNDRLDCDQNIPIRSIFVVFNYDGQGDFPEGNPVLFADGQERLLYGSGGSTMPASDVQADVFVFGDDRPRRIPLGTHKGISQSYGPLSMAKLSHIVLTDTLRVEHLQIGHREQGWKGEIAEIIAFSQPLTVYEREGVENYLMEKYFTASGGNRAKISVDFSKPFAMRSMSGFLQGAYQGDMPDSLVALTGPRHWRFIPGRSSWEDYTESPENEDFAYLVPDIPDMTRQIIISYGWGYPTRYKDEEGNWTAPPYEKWDIWENYLNFLMDKFGAGPDLHYDIWNEPNWHHYWGGSREQYFETYKRTYHIIRGRLGQEAIISGPCVYKFEKDYIIAFLDYCLDNGLEVNVLTWHELDVKAPVAERHLLDIQETVMDNPRYEALDIRSININEYDNRHDHLYPAEQLGYFHYLEQGGAEGGCRACWPDTKGRSTCGQNNLLGLLTPESFRPRSAWWAYKLYTDLFPERCQSQSDNPQLIPLAGKSGDSCHLLIGYTDYFSAPWQATVEAELKGLPVQNGKMRYRIHRLPNTGETPLDRLPLLREGRLTVQGGRASLKLPAIQLHEVLWIEVFEQN